MTEHRILIGVGSNIERDIHTRAARLALMQQFGEIHHSLVYESSAVGFDGPPFYNWVALAHTTLTIEQVIVALKNIEYEYGRRHWEKNRCSRTLDLDLLTFDQCVCDKPIVLPREEILYNAFVLKPLAELVPHDTHPVTGESYARQWQRFNVAEQQLSPIEFEWSSTSA